MQILVFLLGLSLLITIHELGHFLVAKLFGVYCHEFSIGMGPAIFSIKKGETKYSVRWLPIGGYVSMAGEEVNSEIKEETKEDNDDSTSLVHEEKNEDINQMIDKNEVIETETDEKVDIPYERTINGIKSWKRFLVIGAGVFMNFILAYLLFFIYIISVGIADTAPSLGVSFNSKETKVYAFKEAGIPEGRLDVDGVTNKIVYIHNGQEVEILNNNYEKEVLKDYTTISNAVNIPSNIGDKIVGFESDITIEQGEEYNTITFKTKNYKIIQKLTIKSGDKEYYPTREINTIVFKYDIKENQYYINDIEMPMLGFSAARKDASLGEYLVVAGQLEVENGLAIFDALGKLFTKEGINNVGGIIAMADASNTFLAEGFGFYMLFLAIISVNLGVMNLLPIPGLDGSQLLVIIAEGIARRKLPNNTKAIINFIGLVFLMGLMILITIKDVFTFII